MGCWNESCMVTGLPIIENEEVYCFLLSRPVDGLLTDYCYPDCEYEPLPFYFKGKYNDYGGLDECEVPLLKLLLPTLVEYVPENKFESIVKKDTLDVKILFDAIHRNVLRCEYESYNGKQQDIIQRTFIKKSVIDKILNEWKIKLYSGEVITYQSLCDMIPDIIKELSKEDFKPFCIGKAFMLFQMYIPDSVKYNNVIKFKDILNLPENELNGILKDITGLIIINSFLYSGRNIWHRKSGAGSQDTNTLAQRMVATMILDELKE